MLQRTPGMSRLFCAHVIECLFGSGWIARRRHNSVSALRILHREGISTLYDEDPTRRMNKFGINENSTPADNIMRFT